MSPRRTASATARAPPSSWNSSTSAFTCWRAACASSISAARQAAGARSLRRWSGQPASVVGVDLSPTDSLLGATLIHGDFRDAATVTAIRAALGGTADLVLSTWRRRRRVTPRPTICASSRWPRMLSLSPRPCSGPAAPLSPRYSRAARRASCWPRLKKSFAELRHAKPAASRAESAETYVVAKGFRGGA